jgi:hypothetical protein
MNAAESIRIANAISVSANFNNGAAAEAPARDFLIGII